MAWPVKTAYNDDRLRVMKSERGKVWHWVRFAGDRMAFALCGAWLDRHKDDQGSWIKDRKYSYRACKRCSQRALARLRKLKETT